MKVLLYSGGMDSWLIDKLWKPDKKVYVDIGNNYAEAEMVRLPKDVEIVHFPFLGEQEMENKIVPLRNLYFIMIASHFGDEVCLGATEGDKHNSDKTPEFLEETEKLLSYLLADKKINRKLKICMDFVKVSKSELISRYLENGGDIRKLQEETFSCYYPQKENDKWHPCYNCYPCFRTFALYFAHGAKYSFEERKKMWDYIKKVIIPTKEEGGWQGTYYTERGNDSKDMIITVEALKKEFGK